MKKRLSTIIVSILVAGCAPSLTDLVSNSGPERSLVGVEGKRLFLSEVVWDAGLGSETTLPGGFLGGYMFSVPPDSSPGPHPVALRNSWGESKKIDFNVTSPLPFDAPRIDRISLVNVVFDGGDVVPLLYVQGANIDVGAVVQVDGADVATVAHRGLQNQLFGTDPSVMGYPIYHYVALLAVPGKLTAASNLNVEVRNLDGEVSAPVGFALPADTASLDRDGDSLLDSWEINGLDADGDGTIDVDLPGMGVHPLQPDILVEVDVMESLDNPPIPTTAGTTGTFDTARDVFAEAPILNPLGQSGVNLTLDTGGTVPFSSTLSFEPVLPGNVSTTDFSDLKAANFDDARDLTHHYAIWGNGLIGGYSGVSDVDFGGSEVGDDFVVTFDDFPASYQSQRSQVETFVHELGHNLSQRHGGDTHFQYKPNYWSAMAYTWQLRSGQSDATRRARPTCAPIYWADPTAIEPLGAAPASPNSITDYSHGMGPVVVTDNNSLDEPVGVCGVPVHWNGDLDTSDLDVSLPGPGDTWNDFSNWRAIGFGGPADDGTVTP